MGTSPGGLTKYPISASAMIAATSEKIFRGRAAVRRRRPYDRRSAARWHGRQIPDRLRALPRGARTGEALVHLFGVRGLIHANMNLSPFKLYEPDEEGA
jgi:hypothetical protein